VICMPRRDRALRSSPAVPSVCRVRSRAAPAVRLRHPLEILLEFERETLELERLRLAFGAVLVRPEALLPLLAEEDLEVRRRSCRRTRSRR
jgi:hypothetical protein